MEPVTSLLPKPEIGNPCNGCGLCCITTTCAAGSFVMGLVINYGERAAGPCRAMIEQDGKIVCGIMLRPRDWTGAKGAADDLRRDFGMLIGAGLGCDDAGDESDETANPKLRALGELHIQRCGVSRLHAAAARFARK